MGKYEILVLGELETNCYLVWEERSKECLVIDPADDGVGIAEEIRRRGLVPKMILATHGHFDHLLGALDLKLIFGIPFGCSSKDQFLLERQRETARYFLGREIEVPNFKKIDVDLDKEEKIEIGGEELGVIKTPGHTPGSVCFYSKKNGWLFSGDTLFAHGFRGDTKHEYSSTKLIFRSICSLFKLSRETIILPGHGD
ncbi:hypothetical protein A3K55_01750, partial [Candidatus Shapirobacteria bacterium RBG_13_44_7]